MSIENPINNNTILQKRVYDNHENEVSPKLKKTTEKVGIATKKEGKKTKIHKSKAKVAHPASDLETKGVDHKKIGIKGASAATSKERMGKKEQKEIFEDFLKNFSDEEQEFYNSSCNKLYGKLQEISNQLEASKPIVPTAMKKEHAEFNKRKKEEIFELQKFKNLLFGANAYFFSSRSAIHNIMNSSESDFSQIKQFCEFMENFYTKNAVTTDALYDCVCKIKKDEGTSYMDDMRTEVLKRCQKHERILSMLLQNATSNQLKDLLQKSLEIVEHAYKYSDKKLRE